MRHFVQWVSNQDTFQLSINVNKKTLKRYLTLDIIVLRLFTFAEEHKWALHVCHYNDSNITNYCVRSNLTNYGKATSCWNYVCTCTDPVMYCTLAEHLIKYKQCDNCKWVWFSASSYLVLINQVLFNLSKYMTMKLLHYLLRIFELSWKILTYKRYTKQKLSYNHFSLFIENSNAVLFLHVCEK